MNSNDCVTMDYNNNNNINNTTSALCLSNQIKTNGDKYFLFYKSTQNEVIGIRFPNKEFFNLTSLLDAPLCHSPTFYVSYGNLYTTIHIVYFCSAGNLVEIYTDTSKSEELPTWKKFNFNIHIGNLPKGRGIPVMIPNNGSNKDIYFTTQSNEVIMIRHGIPNWEWKFTNLTQQSGAPLCFGDFLFAIRGTTEATNKHVIYQGPDRNFIELFSGNSSNGEWKHYDHITHVDQFPTMLPWDGVSQDFFWKTTDHQIINASLPNDQKDWQCKTVNLSNTLSLPLCNSSLFSYRRENYDHVWFIDENNQLVEIYRKNTASDVGEWIVNQFHHWKEFKNMPKVSGNLQMIPFIPTQNLAQELFWINENKLHRIHMGPNSSFKWEFQTLFDLSNPLSSIV